MELLGRCGGNGDSVPGIRHHTRRHRHHPRIAVAACALAPLALLVLAPAGGGVTPFALQLTVTPDSGRRRDLALTAVAMVLAGAAYSFPAFPGGFAPLTLAAFWLFPAVYVPVLALAVALVAIAAGPYRPRRAPWAMVGIAAALIMLALVAATILWLQYLLTMAAARIAAVAAAAAIAMLLSATLKRRPAPW